MKHTEQNNSDQARRIWPEGESACIWMQAGLVAFKLCDRAFECETCPFDSIMRDGSIAPPLHGSPLINSDSQAGPSEQNQQAAAAQHRPLHFDSSAWYGCGFWYVRRKSERLVEIGLNEVGVAFLPTLREVILPRPGAAVTSTLTSIWLIAAEGTLGLTSPCAGTVKVCNPQLLEALLQKQVDGTDTCWFLEIEAPSSRAALKGLIKGAKAAEYMRGQHREIVETLETALEPLHSELGATSADGGTRLRTLEEMLGSKRYFHLLAQFYRR